jgi:hypothetical protein
VASSRAIDLALGPQFQGRLLLLSQPFAPLTPPPLGALGAGTAIAGIGAVCAVALLGVQLSRRRKGNPARVRARL